MGRLDICHSIFRNSEHELRTDVVYFLDFAQNLTARGATPRNGTKSDQAHPPIHPTKYTNSLEGNHAKVYEFIVRHFLACCSRDAQGFETTATIEINNEKVS